MCFFYIFFIRVIIWSVLEVYFFVSFLIEIPSNRILLGIKICSSKRKLNIGGLILRVGLRSPMWPC